MHRWFATKGWLRTQLIIGEGVEGCYAELSEMDSACWAIFCFSESK